MHRLLVLTMLFAGVAVIVPATMRAEEHHEKRYYDRNGHDYHTWNDHEDRAYRVYLGEQHRNYREFAHVKAASKVNTSGGVTNIPIT